LTIEESKLERLGVLVEDLEKRSEDSENSLKYVMDPKNFYSNHHIKHRPKFSIGYKNNISKIKILEKQNDEIQVKLDEIKLLRGCTVKGLEKYKYVGSTKPGSHHFQDCCLLSRDSDTTLFPEVKYFKSEWNFKQSAHDPKCHLLMDHAAVEDELKN